MALNAATAMQALEAALEEIGVTTSREGMRTGDVGVDLVADIGGSPIYIQVKVASTISPSSLPKQFDVPVNGSGRTALVVVADRVLSGAREALQERGWGWLDLRGHLRLSAPGVLIDTNVSRIAPERRTDDPFAGSVGLEVACALLLDPGKPISVRGLAREIGRSASTVSDVLGAFRRDHLLTRQNEVAVPDMFWAAASAWKPLDTSEIGRMRSQVVDEPEIATMLSMNRDDPTGATGWALSDTLAAAAYGAPVSVHQNHPPDFYVADLAILRRSERIFGLANTSNARGATIRVAPVPQVCSRRNPPQGQAHWPLAHPLFVALDLAKDATRGHEILDGWKPQEGTVRVW